MKWHDAKERPADGETVLVYYNCCMSSSKKAFGEFYYVDGSLRQCDVFFRWDMVIKWCNFEEAMAYLLESAK